MKNRTLEPPIPAPGQGPIAPLGVGLAGRALSGLLPAANYPVDAFDPLVLNLVLDLFSLAFLNEGATPLANLGSWNYPYDELPIGIANVLLFSVGCAAS